jgi:protein TonB
MFGRLILGIFTWANLIPSWATSLRVPPVYPDYAVENCIEGFVRVEYIYSAEGKPEDIQFLESSPVGVFEDAARKNLSYWHYPDRAGEREIKTIEFRLEDSENCNS